MSRRVRLAAAMVGFLLATGCRPTSNAPPRPVRVAAASSLQAAEADLVDGFRAAARRAVEFTFGATAVLAAQIANGAPFDVLLAADATTAAELQRAGKTCGAARCYARGRLVIWQRDDARVVVARLTDLADGRVKRVAIANPDHAPYGQAAVEALRRAAIEPAVRPKLVPADNVRQALWYAENGDVDAAIVAAALVSATHGRVTPVDRSLYGAIEHLGVVLNRGPADDGGERFLDFLRGPAGQAILARHGFDRCAK